MKLKTLSTAALVALTSCSYNVFKDNCPKHREHEENVKTFKDCSYSFLLMAPNVSAKLPENAKVISIKQEVYPFVLFTKSCIEAKYVEFDPSKMPPRPEGMMHRGEDFMKREERKGEDFMKREERKMEHSDKKHHHHHDHKKGEKKPEMMKDEPKGEVKTQKVSKISEKTAEVNTKKAEVKKEITEAKTEINDVKKAVKSA